jgi:uncharacterized OB-fold protein
VSGVAVSVCAACGWRGFPERVWCPRCGADSPAVEEVRDGRVEERTTVHRAVGRELAAPVALATVLLEGGGRVVVRDETGGAAEVALDPNGGAPVARARPGGD